MNSNGGGEKKEGGQEASRIVTCEIQERERGKGKGDRRPKLGQGMGEEKIGARRLVRKRPTKEGG